MQLLKDLQTHTHTHTVDNKQAHAQRHTRACKYMRRHTDHNQLPPPYLVLHDVYPVPWLHVCPSCKQAIRTTEIPRAVPVLIGSLSKQALSHFSPHFLGLIQTGWTRVFWMSVCGQNQGRNFRIIGTMSCAINSKPTKQWWPKRQHRFVMDWPSEHCGSFPSGPVGLQANSQLSQTKKHRESLLMRGLVVRTL